MRAWRPHGSAGTSRNLNNRASPHIRYIIRLLALVRYRSRIFQRAANVGAILQVVLNQSADDISWVFPRREVGRRYDRDGPVCDQGEVCLCNRPYCVE